MPTLTPAELSAAKEDPRWIPSIFSPTYRLGYLVRNVSLPALLIFTIIASFAILLVGGGVASAQVLMDTLFGTPDPAFFPYSEPLWPYLAVGVLVQSSYLCAKSKVQWAFHSRYGTVRPAFPPGQSVVERLFSWNGFRLGLYWTIYGALVGLDWAPAAFFTYLASYVWAIESSYTGPGSSLILGSGTGFLLWGAFGLFVIRGLTTLYGFDYYEHLWRVSGGS